MISKNRSLTFKDDLRTVIRYLKKSNIGVIKPHIKKGTVTYPLIEEALGVDGYDSLSLLEELERSGIVERSIVLSQFSCPECRNTKLSIRLTCMSCGASQLTSGEVIEHLSCGYVGFYNEFIKENRLECPKCRKELKAIGVDYRKLGKAYKCLSCGAVSPIVNETYICQECGLEKGKDELNIAYINSYFVNKDKLEMFERIPEEFSELSRRLSQDGIIIEYNKEIEGTSGIKHNFTLAATDKNGERKDKPDMVIEILNSSKKSMDLDAISFYVKTMDVKIPRKIIAVIPSLNKKSRDLMRSINAEVVEGETLKDLVSQLEKKIKHVIFTIRQTA